MAYNNVNGFIVILEDSRNPDTSWRNHRARGSLGGVDCVAPSGTPIYAPDDCTLSNIPNNGSGGNTIDMAFADGWHDQMMHLSQFVGAGRKAKGELVGYSGTSGGVAPHVHWFRYGGWYNDAWGSTNRYNPWNYFDAGVAGGEGIPIAEEETVSYPIIWNQHVFTFGDEKVKHETSMADATFVKNVITANDQFINVTDKQITAICESFGVPWYAVDAAIKGAAYKIDGTPGGHFWSRQIEVLNAVKGIKVLDQASLNQSVAASVKAGLAGVAVAANLSDADFARIARSVTDEQAARLKS